MGREGKQEREDRYQWQAQRVNTLNRHNGSRQSSVAAWHFGYKFPTIVPSRFGSTRRKKEKNGGKKQTNLLQPLIIFERARNAFSSAWPDFSPRRFVASRSRLVVRRQVADLILIVIYNQQFPSPLPPFISVGSLISLNIHICSRFSVSLCVRQMDVEMSELAYGKEGNDNDPVSARQRRTSKVKIFLKLQLALGRGRL